MSILEPPTQGSVSTATRRNPGSTTMHDLPLYPLRFEPIYQYRLWGGRRLTDLLSAPLPDDGPIGEAWLLSDRDDHASRVADGPLKGRTISQVMEQWQEPLMGRLAGRFTRFPLLLKFLDVRGSLSVQVHPSDAQTELLPPGESGKTEAWVVLEAGAESRIFAGLAPATTAEVLAQALTKGAVRDRLVSFSPARGDGVFIPAGTVHSLSDVMVFEVQQNSDVTFRLYDWDQIDPQTGKRRPLQIDQALAAIDFTQGALGPVTPVTEEQAPLRRESLFHCAHFGLRRFSAEAPFTVGAAEMPHVLVCIGGDGELLYDGLSYPFGKGDVLLLPAVVGACVCRPRAAMIVLEMSLPEAT
jgi:mannose-6-phosphate isomerase